MIVEGIVVGEPDARDACDATNLSVEVDHLLILRLRSGQASNLPDGIPEGVQAAFCTTGTPHIIAISS